MKETFGKSRLANVSKFLLVLLFVSHLFGCAWYLIAALHADPLETWVGQRYLELTTGEVVHVLESGPITQWITSVYFILTVCTTVGFGDITPFTLAEVMFCIFLMLFGAVINSIIVSEVIAVLTRVDKANHDMLNKKASIAGFLRKTAISNAKVETRLRRYAEESTREKAQNVEALEVTDWREWWELCQQMSPEFQKSLAKMAFGGKIESNAFITGSKVRETVVLIT